jgi:GNAT superfamily N-acetyltransferase/mannose-6-phosphate isomerase-like protein (cupin superfamily)
MSPSVTIRPAVRADVAGCFDVRMAVRENRLTSRSIGHAEYIEAIEETGLGWVAVEAKADGAERVLGFAVANRDTGNIWALFVGPAHERRGIGRALHAAMLRGMADSGLTRLWLSTGRGTRAEGFYAAAGWRFVRELRSGEALFEIDGEALAAYRVLVLTPFVAGITDVDPTVEEMQARVASFSALVPTADYIDAGIPGCERTTWRVIGAPPGAPIAAEHFHLNLVHCEPGKCAPLHNHLTQEVFIALDGEWEIFWGPEGRRALRLKPWDTVSIPPGLSRGFRNVGPSGAHLLGIAGGVDPGMIAWPESVHAAARAAGIDLSAAHAADHDPPSPQ